MRKRLIILVSVAVLLPLLILTFVQYRSLVELENKTQAAYKENLRQTMFGVVNRIEANFGEIAAQTLVPVTTVRNPIEEDPQQLEKYFREVKQAHPEIDQIFLFSHCYQCENNPGGYLYLYSDGFKKTAFADLIKDVKMLNIMDSFQKAYSSQNFLDANRTFLYWQHSCPLCTRAGPPHHATYVFYPLIVSAEHRQRRYIGFSFNEGYVQKELIPRKMTEALKSPDLAIRGSKVAVSLKDENKNEILATASGQQDYAINAAFSRPFANWEIGIGFHDETVEGMARHSFWQSLGLNFVVLAFLLIGIILTFRATDREVSLAQAKSAFVSNVSHELKTPLSLIRLFAEMLELNRVKDTQKKQEYYRIIGDESRRLTQLIENILDFSKIEAGRKEYKFARGEVGEVVESVVSSYRYQITSAGFELTTQIEKNLPPALIDRDAISQAILNLLDNAVKYSPETKKISVRVKTRENFLVIEISDTGLGIAPAEHGKIFEKFYRVSNDLVHDVKGSGLGLSLVKHIVEAHGGTVSVESEPGRGSRFSIRLPLEKPETENLRADPIDTEAGGYRIA